jgi:hypothetical protein
MLVVALAAAPAKADTDRAYRLAQSVSVADGRIQILEDARLSPALAKTLWKGAVDPSLALGEDDPRAKPFKTKPLAPARLRQTDSKGTIVFDTVPDQQAPVARIEARRLGEASRPVYLVTTNNDAGFGSYSGRATALYALSDGRLTPVSATGGNGKAEPVVLATTLKSRWEIADSRPDRTVIHQVLCRPDLDHAKAGADAQFLMTYLTYWSVGTNWRMAKRITPGFWESDEGFPQASEFPKPLASLTAQR